MLTSATTAGATTANDKFRGTMTKHIPAAGWNESFDKLAAILDQEGD